MSVEVYSVGLCFASACASIDTTREEVEETVNWQHPTGLESRWRIHDGCFASGDPNPNPCESDNTKQHWLLSC